MPQNKINNPVVHRYNTWKTDKWSILKAAQEERQRLMIAVSGYQKQIKDLTTIIDEHNQPVERDYPQEPMEQS